VRRLGFTKDYMQISDWATLQRSGRFNACARSVVDEGRAAWIANARGIDELPGWPRLEAYL